MTIPTSRPATPFPTPATPLLALHQTPAPGAVTAQRVRKPKAALSIADQPILEALGRYRALTYEQCGRVLGITTAAAGRRMRDLIQLGVVEKAPFRINGVIWVGLTRSGLEEVGLEPKRQPWSMTTMQHTWWVAEIGLDLESRGQRPVTDRELVAHSARTKAGRGDPLTIKTTSGEHFADLRYCTKDAEVAIEIQLTRKSRSEFERILRAYAQDRSITRVQYLTPSPSLAKLLLAAVASTRTTELVTVRVLTQPTPWGERITNRESPIESLRRRRENVERARREELERRMS